MQVYHLTIQENGHSRRFVYEDRDQALTCLADAIAAGLAAKLDEVVRAPALPKPTERLPDEIVPVRHSGELLGAVLIEKKPGEFLTRPSRSVSLTSARSRASCGQTWRSSPIFAPPANA